MLGVLSRRCSPLNQRRIENFRNNRRGYWSLWIFLSLFLLSLFAELLANDRPLVVSYQGDLYFPVAAEYTERTFGGEFASPADYKDPYIQDLIKQQGNGWILWPPFATAMTPSIMTCRYLPPLRQAGIIRWAPMIRLAMYWPGSFMASVSPCCLRWC